MSDSNVIVAVFGTTSQLCRTCAIWQYDRGRQLQISGITLPTAYQVQFANSPTATAKPITVYDSDTVEIPEEYTQSGQPVYAYIYITGDEYGITKRLALIPVQARGAIDDVQPAPQEASVIDALIGALNSGVADAETAKTDAVSAASKSTSVLGSVEPLQRVTSLDSTILSKGVLVETVGIPVYVDEHNIFEYSAYGITESGWYVFADIAAPDGIEISGNTSVNGVAGYTVDGSGVKVAIRFETDAQSVPVTINWGEKKDSFVFKATDLAIRNLDYRTTFYVYDISPYATWEYALTTDANFVANKAYYTKDGDVYTKEEVTAGETVPANTYYNHSKVTFSGMSRNITYSLDEVIDCPQVYILPEIENDLHGCWYEIRLRHSGSYSSTLQVPEGYKVATEHTQAETAGINMVDLHYSNTGGVKIWRFMNTHSNIPA